MKQSLFYWFSCLLLWASLSNCTLTKIVVFFKPNTNDYTKKILFVCDTVHGVGVENTAVSSISKTAEATKQWYTDAHSPSNVPPIEQWVPKHALGHAKNLDDLLKQSKTTALIVIRNDSVLYERYLNGGAASKAQVVFSVTKAITATMTAIAIEEGQLTLDQKVADFIPEFGTDERKVITIRHLLGMLSGIQWDDFRNLVRLGGLYYTKNQRKFVQKNTKQGADPNTVFAYKSLSTQILGICLEKAIGEPLANYLERKVWQPTGMQHNAFVTLDHKERRNSRAFGGMALVAADMARFGKLLLNNGVWDGVQIVPEWFMDALRTRDVSKWFGYSNCFWRNGYEEGNVADNQQFWAAGFSGQYIYVSPKDNIIIVRTGKHEKERWSFFLGRLTSLLANGANDLTDETLDYSNQFEGEYKSKSGAKMYLAATKLSNDKRKQWIWSVDEDQYPIVKKRPILTQFDGVSLGYKKPGKQTRMYYHIVNNKVVGFYYNTWPAITVEYFEKIE